MKYDMKKIFISLMCFVFLCLIYDRSDASTVTWTGNGSDSLASTPANWSGGIVPQDMDHVVFDSTPKNCIWDLSVTLLSITKTSGYTGEIKKLSTASLVIAKTTIAWVGKGSDNLASNPANWSAGRIPRNGDKIVFDSSSNLRDCLWNIDIEPSLFTVSPYFAKTITLDQSLTVSGSLTVEGGNFDLNDKDLLIYGYLLIGPGSTFKGRSSIIEVKGDWANFGDFQEGTSTVVLSGTNQTIYGDTTFYNLIKTVTTADTLYFEAGSTQTVINNLTLQGADGNLLSLRIKENPEHPEYVYWFIYVQGAQNVSYTSIKDMYSLNFSRLIVFNSENAGHNEGVSFGGAQCVAP